jgi:Tol biopolymer transport system component
MRKLLAVLVALFLISGALASSQTAVTGKWLGRSRLPNGEIAFDLKSEGDTLRGNVSLGGRVLGSVNGTISGSAIAFSAGPLMFRGVVNGDEIDFVMRRPAPFNDEEPFKARRVPAFRGGPLQWQLTVYDRSGNVVRTLGEPSYSNELPVLSPDGRRVAVVQPLLDALGQDIWLYDVATGARRRVNAGPAASGPVWSPDGSELAYYAYRQGRGGLYRKRSDGTGAEVRVFQLPLGVSDAHLTDWSPDGRFLVFDTSAVVWVVPLDGQQPGADLLREDFQVFGARFSPDSRFLAYVSDESGRNEVYVREFDRALMRFPAAGRRWRVSNTGGEGMVHWRGDGRQLAYLAPDGRVMTVDISSPQFSARSPRFLFQSPITVPSGVNADDDRNGRMSRDGARIVFAAPPARKLVTVSRAALSQYAGTYVNPGGTPVVVSVEGNRLLVPLTSEERVMFATGENTFFHRNADTDVDIEFARDPKGTVIDMTVYRGAFGTKWVRTEGVAKPPSRRRGGEFPWQLTAYDWQGRIVRTVGEPGSRVLASFSPDGKRVAIGGDTGIWTLDVQTGAKTQVVAESLRWKNVIWSPDGRYLAYLAQRSGYFGFYRKAANGTGREQLLFRFPSGVADAFVDDWSSDGRYVAFSIGEGVLHVLPVASERTPIELVRDEFRAGGARFSPDNRYVAYVSDETGRNEIYVRGFDPSTGRFAQGNARRLSTDGGDGVLDWRPDGRALSFVTRSGAVMSVEVTLTPQLFSQSPRLQFQLPLRSVEGVPGGLGNSGSVSVDGLFLFRVLTPPERKTLPLAPEDLAKYAGIYVNSANPKGPETIVTAMDGHLIMRKPKQEFTLHAESDRDFYRRSEIADVDVEFTVDERGSVTHFVEYTTENGVRWIRK